MSDATALLREELETTFGRINEAVNAFSYEPDIEEFGEVGFVGEGIARVRGLPGVKYQELISFGGTTYGMAFDLGVDSVAVVLLDATSGVKPGDTARRTGRVVDIGVGPQLIGRVVDALGRPLDGKGRVRSEVRLLAERSAPGIMERAPVTVPLQTGIQVIDALIPVGRGQRELIVGDRQTGKTAIAVDTIINQRDKDVLCIYCAVGQRASAVARVIDDLRSRDAMDYTIVVVATGGDSAGMNFIAPYAATSMGEYFMDKGRDVLVVYDDLTRHARSYREMSLLLRRPPAREAYPGDIFYIHARLLERSTHLRREGGGSLTALPIIETQAQNVSAYIPTNLISITDGQIYLNPNLYQQGVLPPVDVGKSVSRVGGKTQVPAYRAVAGDLRLAYSQFEELEAFARFGTRLDEDTKKALERGRRVREVLKQPQYAPLAVPQQIGVLLAVNEGVFDDIPVAKLSEAKRNVLQAVEESAGEIASRISSGEKLSEDDRAALLKLAQNAVASLRAQEQNIEQPQQKSAIDQESGPESSEEEAQEAESERQGEKTPNENESPDR